MTSPFKTKPDICFSVNSYDSDGDVFIKGVFLHFGKTTIQVTDSVEEFKDIVAHIATIGKEIEENYHD